LIALGLAAGAPLHAQLSFSYLDGLETAAAVSADGSTVVGTAVTGSYQPNVARWTASTGAQILPSIPGIPHLNFASAAAVSNDGSVVAGTYSYGTGALEARTQAFRWSAATGTVGLGSLPGRVSSSATGMSGDGSIIVGSSESLLPGTSLRVPPEAAKWTSSTGLTGLGFPNSGSDQSEATAISRDGSTIVGTASDTGGFLINESGMTILGSTSPVGVSSDGTYVVGSGWFGTTTEPVRWSEDLGLLRLGNVPLYRGSGGYASAVSDDGNFIIGASLDQFSRPVSFIWTPNSGARPLLEVIRDVYGFSEEVEGWRRFQATGMSPDARFLVGWAFNPDGGQRAWFLDRGLDAPMIPPGNPNPIVPVPEPATYGIFSAVILTMALLLRRRPRGTEKSLAAGRAEG
jgi:probable HAF family extracellular repeat protein